MVRPITPAEAMYDRYDDQGEHDAATLRAMTGLEPDNVEFTASAIKKRLEAREYYTQEFNLHTDWQRANDSQRAKTSEQIADLRSRIKPTNPSEVA